MSSPGKSGGSEVGAGLLPGPGADADDGDPLGSLYADSPLASPRDDRDPLYGDAGGLEEVAELLDQTALPSFRDDPNLNPFNLTPKELMFCYAYARSPNGAQAARYAGYSGGGSQATKLLQRDDIQGEVRRQGAFINETQLAISQPASAEEVLGRYWEVANASPADLFVLNEDGKSYRYMALADMPQNLRRAIKRIRLKDGQIQEIELHDGMAALGKLAGFQGLGIRPGGMTPWGDNGGGAKGEDGEAEEPLEPAKPVSGRPTVTLTFEQRVNADGSQLRKKILSRSG